MTFRGLLMWVHLVLGLTGAVVIAIVSVTAVYITFEDPLQHWLNPVPRVAASSRTIDVSRIVAEVERQFAHRRVASLNVNDAGRAVVIRLRDRTAVFVNPKDGAVIGVREARFASLENLTAVMRRLHVELLMGPRGALIVTAATAEAFLLALTGLWLWWRKKHWQFRRWRGSAFRVSWDLHNATGIWFGAPVLVMVITGILIFWPAPMFRIVGPWTPWQYAPASSVGVPGGTPVNLDRVLSAADSIRPGKPLTRLEVPGGESGAYAVTKGSSTIYVDQRTGSVIEVRDPRPETGGDRAYRIVEQLHTGELLGIPGRMMMTLGSLMLAIMTITGAVLGWKRLVILATGRPQTEEPP